MAHFFRDRAPLGESKRHQMGIITLIPTTTNIASPFGELGTHISDSQLRQTAYEIFVSACRSSGGKPLTYIPQHEKNERTTPTSFTSSPSSNSFGSSIGVSPSLQRSLTSTAASKVQKALGMKSKKAPAITLLGRSKNPITIGELMRVQIKISAGKLGRHIESLVLPLELLQQFKSSDFSDQREYVAWQLRNLKVLEAGLLHPHLPIDKYDPAAQRLRQILRGASERPIEIGKKSESM